MSRPEAVNGAPASHPLPWGEGLGVRGAFLQPGQNSVLGFMAAAE